MAKKVKSAIVLKLKMPTLPNFVRTEIGDFAIPIETLHEDDLRAIGNDWTEALINHARARRMASEG